MTVTSTVSGWLPGSVAARTSSKCFLAHRTVRPAVLDLLPPGPPTCYARPAIRPHDVAMRPPKARARTRLAPVQGARPPKVRDRPKPVSPNAAMTCTVPAMDLDIATAAATELTRAIRDRQISSRELLDYLLARAEQVNPALNAIVGWDIDRARAAAVVADEATARGELTGPLHGLPMTVKDVFETEGLVTTAGAPELARYMPRTDAVAVARLKAAGAIIFGKSNTPLYAGDWQTYNDVYGRTNNPWDLSRTAGGSSGGAAAAVAAGMTPLELGSDIGGSIRNPSHYNGVYGHKPSWGIVPVRGHIPGPPGSLVQVDIGVAGPIARSIADLRTALGIMAGPLPQEAAGWRLELDPGSGLGDIRELRVATVFGEGTDVVRVRALAAADDPLADGLHRAHVHHLVVHTGRVDRLAVLGNGDRQHVGRVRHDALENRPRVAVPEVDVALRVAAHDGVVPEIHTK